MGILANTVSICQFQVLGEPPETDLFSWAGERLAGNAFRPIDQTAEEQSLGWVHLDDFRASDFAAPQVFLRDHYLTFSLRRDARRVPAPLLRAYRQQAEDEFLAANPGLQRVPKQKREEIKEAVYGALLVRTLPVPAVFDVIWDTRRGLVTCAAVSAKATELLAGLFKQTFEGLRLLAYHPFARAERVVDEPLRPILHRASRAATDAVLDLIEANRWLGRDLLLWLTDRTMHESSEYVVNQPGPAAIGEPFVAYLNDRLVLQAAGDGGVQKVTVAGPQDSFSEVRAALRKDKEIEEAILYLEKADEVWKLTLKGSVFHFASFKAPPVRLEKDDLTDQAREREALFFERMHLLEKGLQLFDSLYAAFLRERLAPDWGRREEQIRRRLEGR